MNTRSETLLPALLAACSLAMFVALLAGGRGGEYVLALSSVWFPLLLIALSVRRRSKRLRVALVALALVCGLSASGVLWLSESGGSVRVVFGLPPTAWLMLGGLGLIPLCVVIWCHGVTFGDDDGRDRGDGRDG